MDISLSFHPVTEPLSTVGKWGVSRRARWHEGNRWRGLSCKSTIPRRRREVSERRGAPNLGAGVIFRGGDLRSGGERGGGGAEPPRPRGRRHTCGSASHHHAPAPAPAVPFLSPPPAYPLPRRQRAAGEGKRTAWPPGARSAGDAAVAPRGGGSKSAPGPGSSRRRRRRSRLGRWQPLRARPNPGRRGYLILDVLLPPLGSDVRGEVLGELHPAVSPSLPPGSGSYRRRRRQQRLRLLPTWAPALRGAALLSSSAAAEVSSEPPSRHLPPPLHSPAPPRPPDVIAMVTAYAARREGAGYGAGPRGELSSMLRLFGPDVVKAPPLTSSACLLSSSYS